ncbi:MAG: four helix bundle protein [Acidobacteria bacterium]|nr:four helix bundle protein [Acidobacteriota bacterium]
MPFDHEKLDVYRVSLEFLPIAERIVDSLPRGRSYLSDQLRRAALSVTLNIAEGAGKFSAADKAAFYARARASATECAGVIDAGLALGVVSETDAEISKERLHRLVQMLTKLILSCQSR